MSMSVFDRTAPLRLLIGDIICFVLSLYIMLLIRYFNVPDPVDFFNHLLPFSLIFIGSGIVFYIAGLYDYHTTIFKPRIGATIIKAQIWSAVIAIALFYFIPFFGITPKISLFLYVLISSACVILWRFFVDPLFVSSRQYPIVIFGSGSSLVELTKAVREHKVIQFDVVSSVDMDQTSVSEMQAHIKQLRDSIQFVVIDFGHEKTKQILPHLYQCLFRDVTIIDFTDLYEEIFKKVDLRSVSYEWLLEHISHPKRPLYSFVKRTLDVIASGFGLLFSALVFPFVYVAIKLDDRGDVFIMQERLGRHKKVISIPKFRSMKASDRGVWVTEGDNRITTVGKFLRKSRIDELPQLWSVFRGDMSLIGPRPDILDLGNKLAEEISYYDTRYVVDPGLSGWAQISQDLPPQSLEETRERLAYDMYYIKHRSLFLDLAIMLKTVRTLLSRSGK